ncbi:putative ATP-dependent helicase IRC20 [Diplogelasinospora grovesii]|uniref:ATP-dependent helicase IRC20 n=1 Tax=Diplogelasinospora grovesii TaxID=303347 RepID=A0AAN6S8P8_9PEZI|nr:putative ATP-dependent helicase IRC20 [Diplogelasinospora grovesii]
MPRTRKARKEASLVAGKVSLNMQESPKTEAERQAWLVEFIQSLPPPAQDTEHEPVERPTKRAKVTESGDAIYVGQKELLLPLHHATLSDESPVVSRRNVSEALVFQLRRTEPQNTSSDWHLHIVPRAKTHETGFRVTYLIAKDDLPEILVHALQLAEAEATISFEEGCLWATAADVTLRQDGKRLTLKLTFELRWNQWISRWGSARATSQQTLRNLVIGEYFPGLQLRERTAPSPWSPQDFYEAAYIPEKEVYDPGVSSMEIQQLEATLYPFQKRAVQWLLQREGARWCESPEDGEAGVRPFVAPQSSGLPISFTEVKDGEGKSFYLSSLFGVATRDVSLFSSIQNIRGGILAEEMGLGKTLEIISLMLLHRRPEGPAEVFDPHLGRHLAASPATLIVTPSSLLDQWLSELSRHAPSLKVLYYPGLKKAVKKDGDRELLAERLTQQDVVITTYDVLKTEIWSAFDEPTRSMRRSKTYERPKSPLVQYSWWRVCIDEAQMVENWTNNASRLATLIPRVNSWAITGTPVKDDIQKDLRGLLVFLRLEPYVSDSKIWKLITTTDKDSFKNLFGLISMRHTKSLVRDEIAIPAQRRYVITMPFTAVEEQHYQTLFKELAEACGLDIYGNPMRDDWDLEDAAVQYAMRTALDRLRQTALHPEVGNRNRRALGHKSGPMRTVAEVLDAMLEQSDGAMRVDQRSLLSTMILRGQILAGMHRVKEALNTWEEVLAKSTELVNECRDQLDGEMEEARKEEGTRAPQDDDESDDSEDGVSPRVGEARRKLRSALEIQHRAVFFCANAYFSIKSDEKETEPDSEEFKRLEKLEVEGYERAKAIRKEILQEGYGKAKKLMGQLAGSAEDQSFTEIPETKSVDQKGIESRKVVDALEELYEGLDAQANQLDEWREYVIQLLLKPLVDEEDDELTGGEYEESTKLQDEILVYLLLLRAAIADRQAVLSGQINGLVEHESRVAIQMAKNGDGPDPPKLLELFHVRDEVKPRFVEGDPLSSLRGVISELRALSVKLRHEATTGSARATAELAIVQNLLKSTQAQQAEHTKAASAMEQELERFNDTLNARLEFYRQLQAVSDMVAEYDGEPNNLALQSIMRQEESLQSKLAAGEAKHRYLVHLKEADSSSEEKRTCVICQSPFSIGVLTVCGHQFCKECITLWLKAHRNCPVCKRKLGKSNLHDITLKPQELRVHSDEMHHGNSQESQPNSVSHKKNTTIYAEFNPEKLAEIKNIDLDGPNFTTKVDTLIRHLFWLRESDPGAKSIVFSQYKEFLDVLALAFRRYRIGYTSFEKAHGVVSFKEDPGTEVFLLHARAHASGLNLVNASHVFLCEPLLNTALELQAIARVHRIGQEHETTVWLYIVDGTVEESIHNLSVQRRMEHMGHLTSSNRKGKQKEGETNGIKEEELDVNLEAANTLELQQAHLSKLMGKNGISGEAVDKNDLWTCLFGHVNRDARRRQEAEEEIQNNPVVRGFLAAEAAEQRRSNRVEGEGEDKGRNRGLEGIWL